MAAATWTLVVCDGSGNALAELTRAAGTSLTFTRNGVPECTFSLSHDDAECATILTALAQGTGAGVPTLKGYRLPSGSTTKVLRFNGYLASISEESGTEASTATFTFRGPFGRLLGDGNNAGRFTASSVAFTATDAGTIARALINTANAAGATGVLTSIASTQTSKTRDRTYQYANVGQAVIDLTNVLDGFDFEVVPLDAGSLLGTLNVYAAQGSDHPAVKFEYGSGTIANCSAVHRQTLVPINVVTAVGANGISSTKTSTASVAKYGRFEYLTQQTDVTDQATLDDKANALLRPEPTKTLDFTPDPRLTPAPWDDYWIGDTVYFYANRGALTQGPSAVRVNQITVAIDPDSGLESTTIPDPVSPDEERVIRASLQTEVVA